MFPLINLSSPAIILLYISIGFSTVTLIFLTYYLFDISRDITNNLELEYVLIIERILYYIGIVYLFVTIIRLGVIYLWFIKAYTNLQALGISDLSCSSSTRMAKASFFIPLYNLWKPYYLFQEIWRVSNPPMTSANGNVWKDNASNTVKIAWISGILFVLFSFLGYIIYYQMGMPIHNILDIDRRISIKFNLILSTILFILAQIIFLICATCYIKIINQITTWQEAKNN